MFLYFRRGAPRSENCGRLATYLIDLCSKLADGEGFEPSVPCGTHAFQACPIDRSGTHPETSLRVWCRLPVLATPL